MFFIVIATLVLIFDKTLSDESFIIDVYFWHSSSARRKGIWDIWLNILGLNSLGERQTSFHLSLFVVIVFMTVLRKDGKIFHKFFFVTTNTLYILMSSRSPRSSVMSRHYWQSAISENTWTKNGKVLMCCKGYIDFPRIFSQHMGTFSCNWK